MKRFAVLVALFCLAGMLSAQTKQEIKEAKRLEKLKYKHSDWPLCLIVRNAGDTIVVKLKAEYTNDYCTTYGGISFDDDGLRVAYGNETEVTVHPSEFREMYIYGKHTRYLVITGDDKVQYITKVLQDGKCQLLFRYVFVTSATTTNNPGGGGTTTTSMSSNLGFYYTLYNDKLTRLLSGNQPALIAKTLAKNCREVFAECPSVVGEINDKTIRREDLAGLVKEFNACVEKK